MQAMWLNQESTRPSIAFTDCRLRGSTILGAILELGPSTTREIACHTGLPLRQVSAAVRHLRVQGLVELDPASIKRRFVLSATGPDRMNGVNQVGD